MPCASAARLAPLPRQPMCHLLDAPCTPRLASPVHALVLVRSPRHRDMPYHHLTLPWRRLHPTTHVAATRQVFPSRTLVPLPPRTIKATQSRAISIANTHSTSPSSPFFPIAGESWEFHCRLPSSSVSPKLNSPPPPRPAPPNPIITTASPP